MADNYLEKKMEDYRRGVAPVHRLRRKRPLEGVCVYVIGGTKPTGAAIVTLLAAQGARVAFSADDNTGGPSLAQRSGARYYPCDMDDVAAVDRVAGMVAHYFTHIDVCIHIPASGVTGPPDETTVADSDSDMHPTLRTLFVTVRRLRLPSVSTMQETTSQGPHIIVLDTCEPGSSTSCLLSTMNDTLTAAHMTHTAISPTDDSDQVAARVLETVRECVSKTRG